jgi:hypothetical protein
VLKVARARSDRWDIDIYNKLKRSGNEVLSNEN